MQTDSERLELRSSIKEAVARQDVSAVVAQARILLTLSSKPGDVMFCANTFAGMTDAIEAQLGAKRLKTYLVRSVTVEPILPFLMTEALFSNYLLDLHVGGYGSYVDEMMNPHSALAKFKPDAVIVVLDLEDVAGRLPELCTDGIGARVEAEIEESLARVGQMLRSFRSGSSARILFQGLVVPDRTSLGDVGDGSLQHSFVNAVIRLNQKLAHLCRSISDCVFFDIDHVAARYGRGSWRDMRLFLSSRLAIAPGAFKMYSQGLIRCFSSLYRAPRKVLCTDLDNTLWGGVLGEEGPDGIVTGSAFPGNCYLEYQKYLKQLSSRGILLAIVSKNNDADVREAFQLRAADLALNLDHFVATKINWNEKSNSIRELAQELSLGLDSFVFVDDNPVECEAIRQHLPEVAVVAAPLDEPWKLVEMLSSQPFFDANVVTEDDVNRVSEYKAQAQRAELATSSSGRDEFLASLGIVCTFVSALQGPLSRSVQLLGKTNQFNLTTRRHSAADIEGFASTQGGQAVVIRVRDRFGDAGVVGLALARNHGDSCYIDSLLLSCRVIGRGIETALLAHLAEGALRTGVTKLVGEFIATKKNAPCADFYPDHGFVRIEQDQDTSGSVFYELDLTASAPASPEWITLEGNELNELSASAVVSA
ncbi:MULTISPECIES: HAD family hydrolase [Acidobacteriaceae]|uniref:HAD-IIIC family phosphatase n=1 Tax=Acidobacteriaceae TaxID=204434 RepID=UPI00131B0854|nr:MULTISPECIES: HAD-IIIC family phosphatase [Acidobacteriaceae]MDW5267498.1 HAD-IIIC family phosphatase [Edaphobacter sp.]